MKSNILLFELVKEMNFRDKINEIVGKDLSQKRLADRLA